MSRFAPPQYDTELDAILAGHVPGKVVLVFNRATGRYDPFRLDYNPNEVALSLQQQMVA